MDKQAAEELVALRLEARVKAAVEKQLFKWYATVAAGVLVVLAALGFGVGLPYVIGRVNDTITQSLESTVKARIDPAVGTAAAKIAQVETALLKFEVITAEIERRHAKILAAAAQAEETYNQLNERVKATDQRIARTAEAVEKGLADLMSALRDYPTARDLQAVDEAIKALAQQVAEITRQIDTVAQTAPAEVRESLSSQSQDVAQRARAVAQSAAQRGAPSSRGPVFVQFAGMQREQIRAISDSLRSRQWTVPGEERIASANALREVRYYFAEDKAAAEDLAAQVQEAWSAAGFGSLSVTARPLLAYPRKPSPGVLELWLGVLPTGR